MARVAAWRGRVVLVVPLVLALGAAPGAGAAPAVEDPADGFGLALNVLPPGQAGTVTATNLARVLAGDPVGRVAVDGKNAPENFADQLEMYDALNAVPPGQIGDLSEYYKPATFGVPAGDVLSVETPKRGVTITWDSFGVPHIKGRTYADVAWGAGYAGTRDRMFLQDVLRHVGAARSVEFLGASEGNVAMDSKVLRSSFYTESEAEAQITGLADRFGAEGQRVAAGLGSYVDGVNAAQDAMCPGGLPTGPECPAEYAALGKAPQPWRTSDVVFVGGLVGGIFGKGGGGEAGNAAWLQRLQREFGRAEGRTVYEDLRARNDPEAPTTATTSWKHGGDPVDETLPGVAMPDLDGPRGTGTGDLEDQKSAVDGAPGVLDGPFGRIDLRLATRGMSNAALVDAAHSRGGHPVAVMGPQTGYFAPQLWTEMALDGPGVKARGVAFAGTNALVQIGRGADYTWSATSSGFDNVDTVIERLCEPDGSRPTLESEHYRRDGLCLPMDRRTHVERSTPSLADPQPPKEFRFQVLRTHHGIVQYRTTVGGDPVAVVAERSTYRRELDSAIGFVRLNDPGYVTDAASFQRAAAGIDFTFNWHYADAKDIAYFGSGRLPVRSSEVDADLPRWGDSRYDWRGFLGFAGHLRQVNPPTGHLVSWNNKSGRGPVSGDDAWGYGSVHRSQALTDRIKPLVAGRDVTPRSLLAAVQDAAVADTRAAKTLPVLLRMIGDDPATAEARRVLRAWLADGALREDRDRDGRYAHQAAIALFDEWWPAAAKDVLRGGLGDLVDRLPGRVDDHPRHGLGSAWNGVAWYGYVHKDLRMLLGEPVRGAWSRSYCGDGALAACRAGLRASLRAAVRRALAAQEVSTVDELSYDKHRDDLRSTPVGLVGVRPLDWQNRPTFQQVVQFTGHR
jgi:acyl-homoserine lactone acylase PvdQ